MLRLGRSSATREVGDNGGVRLRVSHVLAALAAAAVLLLVTPGAGSAQVELPPLPVPVPPLPPELQPALDALCGLSGPAELGSSLGCPQTPPPTDAPAPPASEPPTDDTGHFDEDFFDVPELGLDLALGTSDLETNDAAPVPERQRVVPAAAVAAHPFAYPFVFALPLVLLAVGGYLARSLTDDIRFVQ